MTSTTRGTRPGTTRRRTRAVLAALLAAVALTLTPGTASATTGTVVPIANCYTDNGDGTYTAVLGYRNNGTTTRQIAVGPANSTNPTVWQSRVPTTFKPGTNNGVFTVTLNQAQATGQSPASWTLDGTRLDVSSVGSLGICTASQLPMLANGAALLVGLLAAGALGVVLLRRSQRSAALAPTGPVDA